MGLAKLPACSYCICNPHSSPEYCADKIPHDAKINCTALYNNAVLQLRLGHEEGSTWRIRKTPKQVSGLRKATSGILTAAIELTDFVRQTDLLV